MIRICEELLVFLLNKQSGHLTPVPDRNLHYALAGAVLMDLSLEGRIDTDIARLVMVDPAPLGDEILDPILAMIADDTGNRDAAHWVKRIGTPEIAGRIQDRAINRLIKRRILERDSGGFLSFTRVVKRARRYPTVDGKEAREIEVRIMGIIFADDVPDARDAMLIAVVDACGIFERILSPQERADVADRIDLLRGLDLIGRTVPEAISSLRDADRGDAPEAGRIIISAEQRGSALARMPMATGGLPILGHAIGLVTDPLQFLTKHYQALGPVFRIRVPGSAVTVLAGQEATIFLQRNSRLCLRSFRGMGPLVQRLGAHRGILNMDGADHMRLRKVVGRSFSPKVLYQHLGQTAGIAATEVSDWPEGQPVSVLPAVRRIIAEQTSQAFNGGTVLDSVDDITYYMDKVIACFTRRIPKWALRLPRARRARAVVCRVAEGTLNAHDPELRSGTNSDFVDDLIDLHRADPQFLPENELRWFSLGSFLAGLHTSTATTAFMLYQVLKHPEVYGAMQSEADALFAGEGPTPAKLRKMDVTRRALMETLRLYPVAGVVPRDVVNTFELAGHTIPFGEQILVATPVAHFCEEHYRDPLRFDIDRYLPERSEHRPPGVYTPFGFGTHRCIGARFAEMQVALTCAAVLHRASISLYPTQFELKPKYDPALTPTNALKVKIAHRH